MRMAAGVEWALHCCVLLHWAGQDAVPSTRLAAYHDLPAAYLNKQLQALARAGILSSLPGPRGGFRLARPPERITLMDVVAAIEGPEDAFRCTEIGGGFAGTWAAAAAARVRAFTGADLSVTLIAPGADLVIRPRLYEANPHEMRVPLTRILSPVGARHLRERVIGIETGTREVVAVDQAGRERTLGYRRLVLATGSQLRRPALPGADYLHDVDTIEGAVALDRHLNRPPEGPGQFTAVVIGAGFTGLEVATELIGRLRARAGGPNGDPRRARVVLVERSEVVGPDLGAGPRPAILAALDELGIEPRLGHTLSAVGPGTVTLDDGAELDAATVVWTAGIQASPLTRQVPGSRDRLDRLEVNDELRVPATPEVFAAGDTAAAVLQAGQTVLPSCQHAIPLGKYAGHNAAADLLGLPTAAFATSPYVTCLDLGAAGALFTTGFERAIALRGAEGKARKRTINQQWIYPPLDDPAEILRVADYRVGTRQGTPSGT